MKLKITYMVDMLGLFYILRCTIHQTLPINFVLFVTVQVKRRDHLHSFALTSTHLHSLKKVSTPVTLNKYPLNSIHQKYTSNYPQLYLPTPPPKKKNKVNFLHLTPFFPAMPPSNLTHSQWPTKSIFHSI